MIVHRETPKGVLHAWGTLCGQWAPMGKLATKEDKKTTCQKCLAAIERLRQQEAQAKKQNLRGVYRI